MSEYETHKTGPSCSVLDKHGSRMSMAEYGFKLAMHPNPKQRRCIAYVLFATGLFSGVGVKVKKTPNKPTGDLGPSI